MGAMMPRAWRGSPSSYGSAAYLPPPSPPTSPPQDDVYELPDCVTTAEQLNAKRKGDYVKLQQMAMSLNCDPAEALHPRSMLYQLLKKGKKRMQHFDVVDKNEIYLSDVSSNGLEWLVPALVTADGVEWDFSTDRIRHKSKPSVEVCH